MLGADHIEVDTQRHERHANVMLCLGHLGGQRILPSIEFIQRDQFLHVARDRVTVTASSLGTFTFARLGTFTRYRRAVPCLLAILADACPYRARVRMLGAFELGIKGLFLSMHGFRGFAGI